MDLSGDELGQQTFQGTNWDRQQTFQGTNWDRQRTFQGMSMMSWERQREPATNKLDLSQLLYRCTSSTFHQ